MAVARSFVFLGFVVYVEAVMSIPPLLSSTPPPLEESESNLDHDDDFGEFAAHASVGSVSSTTSFTNSSSVFRPVETVNASDGLYLHDTGGLREADEWSEIDTAVVRPTDEPIHTDSVDVVKKLAADESGSENVGVRNASVSPLTSHIVMAEQFYLGDVSSGCCTGEEVEHNDENLHCEEQPAVKSYPDLCLNTVLKDANLSDEAEEIEHPIDDDDEENASFPHSPAGDSDDLQLDSAADAVMQESEDFDNYYLLSTDFTVADKNEHVCVRDNQLASDEDSTDDFQSFSNAIDTPPDCVLGETQINASEKESLAFMSCKKHEVDTCTKTSAVGNVNLTETETVDTSHKADFSASAVEDSAYVMKEGEGEIMSTLTHEQMLASDEEADNDFDDFEEFVAAKEVPTEHQPVTDSGIFQWNAFENADADDWAAFQDSEPPELISEVSDSNIAFIQQPTVTYSGQLSKDSLSQSLHTCFKPLMQPEYEAVRPLHHAFDSLDATTVMDSKASKELGDEVGVWNGLCMMENTPALRYQWPQSHCNDLLLRAVNIDARNILNPPRRSAAPAFATNLGLLEPKKAVPDSLADSTMPRGNLSFPTEHMRQRQADAAAPSRSMDFKKPEKELLEVLELPDCGTTQSTKSRSSPLDSVLKAFSSPTTTSNSCLTTTAAALKDGTTVPLSAEASAVLSRLPDLSFMHSKVLMFPVSDCAN